ncbi:MAG: gamma carbonic anhydrase family protein [candidate division KSB1 bacterium]|nr:gamma carbonic anhydrase family protein [candidate division KSB1 bacterium]MDZ7272597.1 gamma carbonic anhydrase family protein [candidate division KSB1 bacterium]MDZ7284380.1 gamma carbonic anhydrase family protein [candidate division KSB1 bacterium]MDZ7297224.1 gamma carbonic anhydrase family protein [candidate division KSB1 bacterium]MDZ7348091.1 gamma carbonic anhydrase family protein [candidate division KSB1 bacterium]
MILPYQQILPRLGHNIFLAPNATVIGDVEIGDECGIWFGTVIRGDVNYIRIGPRTNIQDLCMCHVTLNKWPLIIGEGVTVGHSAILHGCVIEDYCLIGMGAKILDGARVGPQALVAAGSLVREGVVVPARTLVAGVPAVVKRALTPVEIENLQASAARYVRYKNEYLAAGIGRVTSQ